MKEADGSRRWGILRIVVVYAGFAALWILLTDTALGLLAHDPALLTRIAILKGILFIGVTACLLYLLIRRHARRYLRSDEARRDSEARFSSYVQNAPVAVLVFDQRGRCVDYNPAAAGLLGYTAEQMARESLADPPAAGRGLREGLEELAGLLGEGRSQGEFPLRRADGRQIWVSLRAARLDESLRLAFCQDVTARRTAEEALRETSHRLELAMAADNLGTWDWEIQPDRLNVDDRVLELYGQGRESFGGRLADWEGAMHPDDRPATAAGLRSALREGRDLDLEYRIVRPDTQVRSIRIHALIVRDAAGRAQRAIGLLKDVTEQKSMEERLRQAQKMESVGRLAGGVAHDFNNMLQVIGSYLELVLQKTDPSQPAYQHLLQVQKAAQRSGELTGQLLAFARKQAVRPRVLDLNEAVAGTLRMLQRLIGEDIELVWIPGPDAGQVLVDPSQLDQVLANLAVNARDAIDGPGTLTISTAVTSVEQGTAGCHADAPPGRYVLLSVSDNGCGMDRETLAHLFEPFFTTKEVGRGTGLGLATVYGIVRQNNGFITVESEPGRGATFRICLPRLSGPAAGPEAPAAEGVKLRGTETILLVEDEESILDLGRMLLEELGYKVLAAGGPEEALRLARRHPAPIHLLLSDVVMPRMSGLELASRLLAERPAIRHLFMSGYARTLVEHGLAGERSYLGKPFTMTELSRKVRETLDSPD